jgi:hypothetical protein
MYPNGSSPRPLFLGSDWTGSLLPYIVIQLHSGAWAIDCLHAELYRSVWGILVPGLEGPMTVPVHSISTTHTTLSRCPPIPRSPQSYADVISEAKSETTTQVICPFCNLYISVVEIPTVTSWRIGFSLRAVLTVAISRHQRVHLPGIGKSKFTRHGL